MANRLVGDENCSYHDLISVMSQSTSFESITNEWRTLVDEFKTSPKVVNEIDKGLQKDNWTANPVMRKLLENWRLKFPQATLQQLLNIFEKCGLNDLSNEIRKYYKIGFAYPHQTQSQMEPTLDIQHHSSGYQMPTASFLPANPQPQAAVDDASVDWPFPSIFNFASGKKIMTKEDWDARIISAAAGPPVSLVKGPHTNINEDFYRLPGIKSGNGFALILNIIRYPHEYRKGAQYDSFMLTQLLTQLGYDVVKYDDPHAFYKKDDVKGIVELFRDHIRHKNPASVLVFIGGHGMFKDIQTSDGKRANLYTTIVYQFDSTNCPELEHVPKIFILQCCRSFDKNDAGGFQEIKNAIICYATLPGNLAARVEVTGSRYIRTLVEVISHNAHCKHLTEMLDQTKTQLSALNINYGGTSNNHQNSSYEVLSSFGKLYFNCE